MENESIEACLDFNQTLHTLYKLFQNNEYAMNTTLDNQLNALMKNPKEEMDVASYMLIVYMKGIKYETEGNKNAACYSAMRLLWMKECMRTLRKKRPLHITFSSTIIPEKMDDFIKRQTSFLRDVYSQMNRKLLIVTIILFILVYLFLLFININWIVGAAEALFISILNYVLQRKRFPDMFQKRQTQAVSSYIENVFKTFDQRYK